MTEVQRDEIVRETGWKVHPSGRKNGNHDWFWIYSEGTHHTTAYRELTLGWPYGRCRVSYWVDTNKFGVRKNLIEKLGGKPCAGINVVFDVSGDRGKDQGNVCELFLDGFTEVNFYQQRESLIKRCEEIKKWFRDNGFLSAEYLAGIPVVHTMSAPLNKCDVGGNSVVHEELPIGEAKKAVIPELHLRPIPRDIVYPSDVKRPNEIGGVVSWVTSIGALFDRQEIVLSDGRRMRPGSYIIPPYQRKYTWSYDNVSQLCRDLLRSADGGKETYHLGTIILHHQPGEQGNLFYVVDGQQRLTTISYLIQSEIFTVDTASPKIKKSDINNILSALEEYQDDKERILEQLKRSTLVVIAVSDINEAFQLFSTQNGRGRPLTPANLLKAYHLHELEKNVDAAEKDRTWEANNAEKTRDGRLLSQVLGEHLYRLRCWSRGDFPKEQFSNANIKEFKGITFNTGNAVGVPAQNMMKLRQRASATHGDWDYYSRSINDGMNPLSMIDQPIVNGGDFFSYIESYAEAYRVMFGSRAIAELQEFRNFYGKYCTYKQSGRRGDTYARHIFESLSLFCYDRFGAKGLCACERYLYRCAYYERAVKSRCYYSTCGGTFAIQAVRAMVACMTLADVKDRLHALNGVVLELYRKEKKIFAGKPVPEGILQVRSIFEN